MTEEEQAVWDAFYGEIVGWSLHPGYLRDAGKDRPTLEECAQTCDQMITVRRKRLEQNA
jgi:hypothetical protein